jgi:prevent-host-death family protein
MRIENIREVKAKLSQIVKDLPREGSLVITRNGKACAVLMPVTEETDLEVVALSQNRSFWKLFDRALSGGDAGGWTSLEEL